MLNFFYKNSLSIFCILTVLSVCIFHFYNLYFLYQIDGISYAASNLTTSYIPYDELVIYGPRISEALEGSFLLSDSYTFEHQNKFLYLAPFLGENIASIFLWIFNGNYTYSNIFMDIIFSALIFLALFKLFNVLGVSKFFSVIFSAWTIVFYDQFSIFMSNPNFYSATKVFPFSQHLLTRSVLSVSLLVGLVAVIRTMIFHNSKTSKNFYLALIPNAILIYFNIFIFIFITFFNLFSLFFSRIHLSLKILKEYSYAIISFILIVSFYFINQFYLSSYIHADEIISRVGMAEIRGVSLLSLVYLCLFLILFLNRKMIPRVSFIVLSSALASLFISKNIQLVIGYNPQIFHYDRDIGRWILLAGIFSLIYGFHNKFFSRKSASALIISIFMFFIVISSQLNYSQKNYINYSIDNSYFELFSFLNSNTPSNSVIATDLNLTKWIPSHTHNNTLIAISPASMVSDEESISRLLYSYSLLGYSDDALNELESYETYIDLFHFKSLYKMSSYPMENLEIKKTSALKSYRSLLKSMSKKDIIQNFRVDYILFDINKNNFSNYSANCCQKLYENKDFLLVEVQP